MENADITMIIDTMQMTLFKNNIEPKKLVLPRKLEVELSRRVPEIFFHLPKPAIYRGMKIEHTFETEDEFTFYSGLNLERKDIFKMEDDNICWCKTSN